MGIKTHSRTIFINPPEKVIDTMELPELSLEAELTDEFDYIHFFVTTQEDFNEQFPILRKHLKTTGMLWASWPKSGKLNTDLNIKSVIRMGYEYGLVESKCISVDTTWSALKFTHPKLGKIYKNSFGKLQPES